MKQFTLLAYGLAFAGVATAGKYGVDEALSESSGGLSDAVWGALLVGVIIWAWRKFM